MLALRTIPVIWGINAKSHSYEVTIHSAFTDSLSISLQISGQKPQEEFPGHPQETFFLTFINQTQLLVDVFAYG